MARLAVNLAALAALLLPLGSQAPAQEMPQGITPPEVMSDPNGLNLVTGKVMTQRPTISIPAAPRLSYSRASDFFMYMEGQTKISQPGVGKYSINYGGDRSEEFDCTISSGCEAKTSGGTFSGGAVGGNYLQAKTAARYTYIIQILNSPDFSKDIRYVIVYASRVAYPDGEILTLEYEIYIPNDPSARRLKKVSSNTGYFLGFDYWDSDPGGLLKVKTAGIYATASPTVALARLDYSLDGYQVTDMLGRTWSCSMGCGQDRGYPPWLTQDALTLPGEGAAAVTYTKNASDPFLTQTIIKDGVNWGYSYGGVAKQVVGGIAKTYKFDSVQVNGPNGYARSYTIHSTDKGPSSPQRYEICCVLSSTDELNRRTDYGWVTRNFLGSITYPEGNKVEYEYASAGGSGLPTKRTDKAKPGSGGLDIVQEASYGAHYLWRPDWYKDALGRQTDYVHSSSTGQLTRQLDPPDAAGVRKQTDIEYTPSPAGLSRKTLVRVCGNTTTCSGNAESHTEYTYFGDTYLPQTVTEKDEATGATRVTTYAYDAAGRMLSEDGPLSGTADTKYFRYDAFGRRTWEIGPADANGLRIAKRFTYRPADDKLAKVETGTIPDPNSTNLTLLEQTDTTYDGRRYPIRELTSSGGTTYRVTDRSFLDRGLADCTTARMNFASAPFPTSTSACALGATGSQGPDRITKNIYDNAAQLLKVQKAYLITTANGFPQTLQQDYVTYAYTLNGKQQFVTDANGNKAQYKYDGFDRLQCWIFPSKTTAGQVSGDCVSAQPAGGDFEKYTYDDAGNRLTLRRRDGRTLSFTYDNLNRILSKLVPDGCPPIQPPGTGCPAASATRDVFYAYDVLGRQLTAKFDSQSGADGVTNSYDGFGNLASSAIAMGGFTKNICSTAQPCLYDADDNRTQVNIDGQTFTYAYDARDRPTHIAELGQLEMIGYAYDNAGRPSWFSRRNGRQTFFEYDPISRPSALINSNFTGPADVRFEYGYNPASQVAVQWRSNDTYAFTAIAAANTNYTRNGLNEYTAVGGTAPLYDGSGNLIYDGFNAYVYDGENRLVWALAAGQTTTLTYDPLGRLWRVQKGAADTRFLYDGDALVAEYDGGGAMTNRYVHGPSAAADDPLVQYVGSGIGTRRFLETDHLGSVILIGDNAGAAIATNRYDEYGVPQAGNQGRFQYTGQIWLGELGLYHYKTRLYSPVLGRFLQTDPVGYFDEYNLYAYVGNDPVTASDPTGNAKIIGWIIELGKQGHRKIKPLFSKSEAVKARQQEKNIKVSRRQKAGEIEGAAFDNPKDTMRHRGHDLGDGEKGAPHFQTKGKSGHTFYDSAAALGAGLLTVLEAVDQLTDPLFVQETTACDTITSGCNQKADAFLRKKPFEKPQASTPAVPEPAPNRDPPCEPPVGSKIPKC